MDLPIAAFDIETIPDPDAGRRLWGLDGDDGAVIEAMLRRRLEETGGDSDFHAPPFHRVVCVAVAWLDDGSGSFKLAALPGEAMDEQAHLHAFFDVVARSRRPPRLVSWNGSGFDMPVLRYRAMIHGVAAPELYRSDGDWRWNNYQNRYHDMHCDLMDCLCGFGASSRVRLDDLARLAGLPGKTVTEGHRVYGHILRGEVGLVREYCELDSLNTLLLYLLWAVHRGRLTTARLAEHVGTIRAALAGNEQRPAWKAYGEALEGWPAWASESG